MYDGDDARFAARVHATLGEGANPHYYACILNRGPRYLLEWLHRESAHVAGVVTSEMAREAEGQDAEESEEAARAETVKRRLGFSLMRSGLRGMLFVVDELQGDLDAEIADATAASVVASAEEEAMADEETADAAEEEEEFG